jgi:16S rRNA processing protein RimM
VVGRIAAPFGVHGWVKVQPLMNGAVLLECKTWHLGRDEAAFREVEVMEAAQHGKTVIARLDGIADRDAASTLVGERIAVPASALPGREEGEYYWSELIGLSVINRSGEVLGKVSGLLETGVHDVLVVRDGDTERLLPMVGAVVDKIDIEAGEIRVEWGRDW